MNKEVKGFSVPISVIGVLFIAVVLGQGQDIQKDSTDKAGLDLVPVTLSMKWTRGDPHYGANFIRLSTPCQISGDGPCECAMQFKGSTSQEFADYISSFSDASVPVVYKVLYGDDGLVRVAQLENVGSWQADRFHVNDRLLGIHFVFAGGKSGQRQKVSFRAPTDCFPRRENETANLP